MQIKHDNKTHEVPKEWLEEQIEKYNEVIEICRKYGLIVNAVAGIVILQHPQSQIEDGNYIRCLSMAMLKDKIKEVENE